MLDVTQMLQATSVPVVQKFGAGSCNRAGVQENLKLWWPFLPAHGPGFANRAGSGASVYDVQEDNGSSLRMSMSLAASLRDQKN